MKKTLAILELILLLLILYGFGWGRFDERLSNPFYLEMNITRVLISIGISIAIIIRVTQILKFIWTGEHISQKSQLVAMGLYLLMIGTDLYEFIKWNIYADIYIHVSIILITPILLGIVTNIVGKRKNEPKTKKLTTKYIKHHENQ